MSTHGDGDSRNDDSRNDDGGGWLLLLVRIAWRPFLAGLVILVVVLSYADSVGGKKERAYMASMKFDLRDLVTAEASYFTDNATYTSTFGNLVNSRTPWSTLTITAATSTGWAATAKHVGTTHTCGIYVGSATAPVRGQKEGEPKCV